MHGVFNQPTGKQTKFKIIFANTEVEFNIKKHLGIVLSKIWLARGQTAALRD